MTGLGNAGEAFLCLIAEADRLEEDFEFGRIHYHLTVAHPLVVDLIEALGIPRDSTETAKEAIKRALKEPV